MHSQKRDKNCFLPAFLPVIPSCSVHRDPRSRRGGLPPGQRLRRRAQQQVRHGAAHPHARHLPDGHGGLGVERGRWRRRRRWRRRPGQEGRALLPLEQRKDQPQARQKRQESPQAGWVRAEPWWRFWHDYCAHSELVAMWNRKEDDEDFEVRALVEILRVREQWVKAIHQVFFPLRSSLVSNPAR